MTEDMNPPTCDIVSVFGCSNEAISTFLKRFMQKDGERYLEEIHRYSFLTSALQENFSSLTYTTIYRGFFNT